MSSLLSRRSEAAPFSCCSRGTQVAICKSAVSRWGRRKGDGRMLETIAIILIILWLLGMVSGYTLGNFIWVLLVVAVYLEHFNTWRSSSNFILILLSGRSNPIFCK
jgi:hypothetical protein